MLFSGSRTARISIFVKVQLVHPELFTFFITVLTYEFYFFPFRNFRAWFDHFSQSKQPSIINWMLFSGTGTARISIFIKVQLVLPELFTFFITVLTHEFIFFRAVTSKRILTTLVKANSLPLLIECCSAGPELLESRF